MIEGQKVICINDQFTPAIHQMYDQLPVKDVIYTVREVSMGRGKIAVIRNGRYVPNGGVGFPELRILLNELHNPPDPLCIQRELGFNAERFAPLETAEESEERKEVDVLSVTI